MPLHYMEPVFRNRIIRSLPPEELRLLRPLMTRMRLMRGQTLFGSGEHIDQLYFIEEGLISLAPPCQDVTERVEVDYAGRQSAIGVIAILNDGATSFHRTMVQIPGVAYRVMARSARDYLPRLPTFKRLLIEDLEISHARLSQNTACRATHSLAQRLARWLVMARDLADGGTLQVTQEMLATMLAVRRPGVSVALARLEEQGLVKHRRGNVIVSDRDQLAAVACNCDMRLEQYTASLSMPKSQLPPTLTSSMKDYVSL